MSKKNSGTEAFDDLNKWGQKINAMMIASVGGEAPQIFKAIMFRRMGEFWTEKHKENNEKSYKEAEKIIDNLFEKHSKIKVATSLEEAEKNIYEK